MTANKNTLPKNNNKASGSSKTPTRSTPKKPVVKRTNSNGKGISPYIWLVFILILLVGGLFFVFSKRSSSNKPKNKTHYITANQEPEKLDVKTYVDKEGRGRNRNSEKSVKKTLKNENQTAKTNVTTQQSNNSNTANNSKTFNKAVAQDKEWQPINPGVRAATNSLKNLVYAGKPVTRHILNVLENMSYYSAYSEKKRNPLWVAYRLDVHKGQNQLKRPSKFTTDFRTKSQVNQKIYLKSGYDKGHLCPNSAIAARYGKEGQMETFLMSNISPQTPELNRKVWERLERLEEAYANKFGGIWVFTGPIFDQHIELLGRQVEIPDAFYKILVDEDQGKVRVLPFIIPQKVTGKEILNEYLTTVDEIESRTGLDFFSTMDDEYEKKLESYLPAKTMWR